MATIKTKGIVISENNMGDFDKMITLLTPNGKISCSARGSRRPKSQLMAGSQFLCFGDYMLFKSPSTYSLNSCEPIEILTNLKDSFERSKEAAKRRFERHPNSEEQLSKYRVLENNIRNESFWLFYAEPPSKTEVELVKKVLNVNSCESINEMIQNYRAVANALEIGNNCVISIKSEHIIKDEDNSKVNPNEVRFSSRPRVQRTNDDLDEI